jgi:eukaryotic-like serine/threonine-protein kinase
MTTLTATGQVIAARYELTRFVAGGAMGEVWAAHDERMDRTVAVKILRPEYAQDPVAVQRFRTEARLAARLTHPGITQVHDVDNSDVPDQPAWMVQEFVPGQSLSELMATTGPLDPLRVARLVAQAAEGVHAAHLAGVVHRDLTPRNVLVCDGDLVKITDFGIARAADLPPLTATGQVMGAAAYLSPEQVRGRPATPASDIYTLGVVLYECLTGARPFTGANLVQVARAHLHQQPPPLPGSVPAPLRAVVSSALAKNPADRPGSAAVLADRLRAAAQVAPSHVAPPQQPPAAGLTRPLPQPIEPEAGSSPAPTLAPVIRGAAAVRAAVRRSVTSDAAPLTLHLLLVAAGRVRRLWEGHPVSRAGLAGAVVLLLVVAAVLSAGSAANAAPGIDTAGPGGGYRARGR